MAKVKRRNADGTVKKKNRKAATRNRRYARRM